MVKQQDIADALNVSRTTVARALAPNGIIHPDTRKLILEKAAELGYKKNIISSTLASKKKKTIYAFIVNSVNEKYSSEIIRGIKKIESELNQFNLSIKIIETDINKPQEQLKALKEIIRQSPDGIIITPLSKDEIKDLIVKNSNIPFLTLDICIDKSVTHVGSDYLKSGRIMGNLYASFMRENEEILIFDTDNDKISSKLYIMGVLEVLKNSNIKINGPHYHGNLLNKLDFVFEKYYSKNIKAVYSSRFLNSIIPHFISKGSNDLIAIGNGLSNATKDLILKNQINAAVVENNFDAGYTAGKQIFELLNNGSLLCKPIYITTPSIIIKENLA